MKIQKLFSRSLDVRLGRQRWRFQVLNFTWTTSEECTQAVCALGSLSIMGGIKNLIIIGGDCGDEYWFVKYAVEMGDLPLFSSRNLCKNKGYRIIGGKQCHFVNKRILFEITPMQSVNPRIAALFYVSAMKVLKVRPMVRRKIWFHSQISAN